MLFLCAIMIVIALMVATIAIIALIVEECSEPAADFVVLSPQAARPPEADRLYEGLYEDFVQGNR